MKSNLIEITVSGQTGCGKSEVLEVIADALKEFYGHKANITGSVNTGAIKEAEHTRCSGSVKNTVFVLFEQNYSGSLTAHNPKCVSE